MSLGKFLTSFTFFKQLFLAIVITVVFLFALIKFLDFRTNHGEEINVPDLSKMKLEVAEEKLDEDGLEEQDPKPNSKVKDGRKIYVKLNAGGFSTVTMPDLINKTFRQAASTIRALGLVEGKTKYVPNIAKDVVLEISQNGKKLKPGDKILKNSTIDFVLGDGKELFKEEELDSVPTQNIDTTTTP